LNKTGGFPFLPDEAWFEGRSVGGGGGEKRFNAKREFVWLRKGKGDEIGVNEFISARGR